MKLRDFSLLTDENLDPDVVAYLRQIGFDVLDVVESGRRSAVDIDLLRLTTSQGRAVVTHDADFGTLAILQREPLVGIVFLRPGHVDPEFTMETIEAVLNADLELVPTIVLVAKRTGSRVAIRTRSLGPELENL